MWKKAYCVLLFVHELLNVVHDEHVDALVEVHEVVKCVATHRVGVLHLEQVGTQVEDTLLRM